jgi:hypothetical protein
MIRCLAEAVLLSYAPPSLVAVGRVYLYDRSCPERSCSNHGLNPLLVHGIVEAEGPYQHQNPH